LSALELSILVNSTHHGQSSLDSGLLHLQGPNPSWGYYTSEVTSADCASLRWPVKVHLESCVSSPCPQPPQDLPACALVSVLSFSACFLRSTQHPSTKLQWQSLVVCVGLSPRVSWLHPQSHVT
jgi:hypothetical protein